MKALTGSLRYPCPPRETRWPSGQILAAIDSPPVHAEWTAITNAAPSMSNKGLTIPEMSRPPGKLDLFIVLK